MPTARERFIHWAKWGVLHAPDIHYAQIRPIPVSLQPGHLPLTTDCSGSTVLWAKWAAILDPTGNDFDGTGNTDSMWNHLDHVSRAAALPGDLVVFGTGGDTEHVVILLEPGSHTDPLCVSHGQEAGPTIYRLSVEIAVHNGPVTFLKMELPLKYWRFDQGNGWSEPKSRSEIGAQLNRIAADKDQDRTIQIKHFKDPQS